MQFWILTFERPVAVTRLIKQFNKQGITPWILSNSPEFRTTDIHNWDYKLVFNTANSRESNAWCSRAWNTIYQKAFDGDDEVVCIQDDTNISNNFVEWLNEQKQRYDFISGPAGDQFHFIKKNVFTQVGWWDERFAGACYCADADYFKRVYIESNKNRISIQDSHNWGFTHNPCGVDTHIITTYESKTIDPNYENQHWALEKLNKTNPVLKYNQEWFKRKWGVELDNGRPVIESLIRYEQEINWYPWATKKFGVSCYDRI